MGGSGGSLLLSWHPLQNNWMAYQVMPWSLIAMFCSSLAERQTPLHACINALHYLDIINSYPYVCGLPIEPCLHFSIEWEAQGQQGTQQVYRSLKHHSVMKYFLTFSAPSSSVQLIRVWMLQCTPIQRYWVIFGDGLLSRSSHTQNWFSIMTTNKQYRFEATLLK